MQDWKKPGSVGRMFKGLEGPLRAEPHDPKYPGGPVFNFASECSWLEVCSRLTPADTGLPLQLP
jgi:hypothetical protein